MSDELEHRRLVLSGIDISHERLVELTRLADQARPFYAWVEQSFRGSVNSDGDLDAILRSASQDEIETGIRACYKADPKQDVPLLFDGIGRTYTHQTACYYFFSWLVRDAPKQRLEPLLQRIVRSAGERRQEVECRALAALIHKYRANLKTFAWPAIREVIVDRLEGSRRSIAGHEREVVARMALVTAVQAFYTKHGNYGAYATVEIPAGQIRIGNETYDVSARLLNEQGETERRILMPVKTRETEGGGHSHLFTRDIMSAINAARASSPEDYVVAVIVAGNWAAREADIVRQHVDHAAIFDVSPTDFGTFDAAHQAELDTFIAGVLQGTTVPIEPE